jgi:hypothetical protein
MEKVDDPRLVKRANEYFWGGCAQCGRPSNTVIHQPPATEGDLWSDWVVCESCKTRWRIGANLFSAPKILPLEDPTYRERAREIFAQYREVPVYMPEWAGEVMRRDDERRTWESILRDADMTLKPDFNQGNFVVVKGHGGGRVCLSIKLTSRSGLVVLPLTAIEARRLAEALLEERRNNIP